MTRVLQFGRRLRRKILLHRRLLAGLLAGVAVLVGLEAASAQPPLTQPVWVAARDLPSGTVLAGDDFTQVGFRPGSAPTDLVAPSEVTGHTLAVPLHRGEALTSGKTVGAGMLTGHPGRVAVPVRVTDPAVAGLLGVGDRVDLVVVDPQDPEQHRVVPDVEVLALPRPSGAEVGSGPPGRLVVVAALPGTSDTLAAVGVSYFVTVRWNS